MAHFNSRFIPISNDPLPPEFAVWPLDMYMDDDEFRAGYPFSPLSEVALDEECTSLDSSSAPKSVVMQSMDSHDDRPTKTVREKDQSRQVLPEKQKVVLNVPTESCKIPAGIENHSADVALKGKYVGGLEHNVYALEDVDQVGHIHGDRSTQANGAEKDDQFAIKQ